MRRASAVCLALALPLAPLRADPDSGKWVPVSEGVTSRVKSGYPGKTAGVAADPATGDVYMVVPDQGVWKSTVKGETFVRADGGAVGGRCETGFALNFDPAGRRLACFMIYGGSASTEDAGKTWSPSKVTHFDFGAVDWGATGKCFLAVRHESGGTLALSADAGKTWPTSARGSPASGCST